MVGDLLGVPVLDDEACSREDVGCAAFMKLTGGESEHGEELEG